MESLFRLVLSRPAIAQSEATPSIRLAQNSQFQADLAQAHNTDDPREALKAVARQFVATPGFVGDPKKVAIYEQLKALAVELAVLEKKKNLANAEVAKAIDDAFGKKNAAVLVENFDAALLKDINVDAPMAVLRDSLIAIKLLPEEQWRAIEDLTNQLRDLEVIVKVIAAKDFPGTGEALRRYRRRSVLLPDAAILRSSLSTSKLQAELESQRAEAEARRRKEAEAQLSLYKRLKAAVQELTNLDGEHFQSTVEREDPGFLVPPEMRPTKVYVQEMTQRLQLASPDALVKTESIEPAVESQAIALPTSQTSEFLSGNPPFKPLPFGEGSFRLKPTAEQALSTQTLDLLQARGVRVSERPLDRIVELLNGEALELSHEIDALVGRPVQRNFKRLGNTLVTISTPLPTEWNSLAIGTAQATPTYVFPFDGRVPQTHGSLAPAGIADLLVVKQQLVRYETADVAHIESVLKGEKKEREHTRRRETEEISFREVELTTTEERELESTNRFELSRETSETIKEDASLKAGLTVSGKYGPVVEFSASAEGSQSRSKEEATKAAAKFSQDVTERSATKVTERVLERSSLRVTNEVIEKNTHTLDNTGGAANVAGVYQWVNKVYQAQLFNYGLRMIYDFMVPEPAAFLIAALQDAHASAVELEKPLPFTLLPSQITESNYHTWVQQYGATDVQPPPEIYRTKSMDFKAGGGDDKTDYNHSAQITIDDGYKAIFGTVSRVYNIWDDDATLDVALGAKTHRLAEGEWLWSTPLSEERDSIPLALDTFHIAQIAVAVEIKCQRTDRAMTKWQHETHAKLTNAYRARLAEYEEKLAALEIQAGVAIRGKNPALNLEMMNDELKKNCISILTEQHFDLFGAIQEGGYGVPQIDLYENAAEGPYVRFFEQAFEWEHMTWVTYPYFWGRKSQWRDRVAFEDFDPIFNQFLKAGYCRVAVPVRPGFEGALDHFMTYGEIWNGGPLPTISNPLYLPIADEIAERLDRPDDEIPQGEPWLVRIPTTLVRLRPDDTLPEWQQAASGNWLEA
ncbi:MAG TPA: hypothetical protein VGX68_01965 [Thermoanaerobaculia bacterium]|jgi:hypothetical protein|nr:hypothetical protein [Thermoanaerobaculia bacterium]